MSARSEGKYVPRSLKVENFDKYRFKNPFLTLWHESRSERHKIVNIFILSQFGKESRGKW